MLLFAIAQFHLPFYCSRTLPNTFALLAATLALSSWLLRKPLAAIALLTATTVIFRCDMLILLAPLGLQLLLSGEVGLVEGVRTGALTGAVALALTVAVDSQLWGRWLWPEGTVLFFNTALNKSSEWGVSPWHWYLSSALPRAMHVLLLPLATGLCGVKYPSPSEWLQWRRGFLRAEGPVSPGYPRLLASTAPLFLHHLATTALYYAAPALGFIALYSLLAHKELRFILPVLPWLLTTAAFGLDRLLPPALLAPTHTDKTEDAQHAKGRAMLRRLDHTELAVRIAIT